jgi:signal peptidase II
MSILGISIVLILLVGLDQVTKYLAIVYLKSDGPIPIIKNVFELSYVENRGAAFGIMQNKGLFFVITTFIILAFILYYYRKIPKGQKYNLLRWTLLVIVAGAIGNLIDRLYLGYVVDFFYFKLINFPVFNVADIYVTVGAILLLILILFVYKEDELIK